VEKACVLAIKGAVSKDFQGRLTMPFTDIWGRTHRYPPPVGYQPRNGTFTFNAADEWARLVESGFTFDPWDGPTQISSVRGSCLEPLVIAGRDLIVSRTMDPDEPLVDGRLYAIEHADDAEIQAYREKMGIPAHEPVTIVKVLRFLAGSWHTQCNDSLAELNGEVVEQVTAIVPAASHRLPVMDRPAVHAYQPTPRDSGQLGLNAATSLVVQSLAGPTTVTAYTNLLTVTLGPYAFNASIVLTATGNWQITMGASSLLQGFVIGLSTLATGITIGEALSQQVLAASNTAQIGFALEETVSLAAGTTTTYYLAANFGSYGSGLSPTVNNVSFKAEVIKR
jgi:hypothetical protein